MKVVGGFLSVQVIDGGQTDPRQEIRKRLAGWGFGRLQPDGLAVLVVQKHLGADSLQRWLVEQGHATERVASRSSYRLLRVAARTPDPEDPS